MDIDASEANSERTAGAGELIAEGVLAVEMGACAEDLSLVIHPHPRPCPKP